MCAKQFPTKTNANGEICIFQSALYLYFLLLLAPLYMMPGFSFGLLVHNINIYLLK